MSLRPWHLLAWLLPGCLTACGPHGEPPGRDLSAREAAWCLQIHQQVNHYRRQHGLTELSHHPGLQRLSLDHCRWLVEHQGSSFHHGRNVSHFGSHSRNRTACEQYGMEAWGENVAYSSAATEVAHQLVLMWQASPSHHRLLVGNWTHSGVAVQRDEKGAIFATQTFGRLKPGSP